MIEKYEDKLLFDNDIEVLDEVESRNQMPSFRMNINTSVSSFLLSSLENIYTTIKDRPDIELKFNRFHQVGDDGQSFKEEVLWALNTIRDFENEITNLSLKRWKEKDTEQYEQSRKRISKLLW
tara:strand:+ start:480 stop:848 length:369 start_codon:yes stop_codon:yes gene_type:complete